MLFSIYFPIKGARNICLDAGYVFWPISFAAASSDLSAGNDMSGFRPHLIFAIFHRNRCRDASDGNRNAQRQTEPAELPVPFHIPRPDQRGLQNATKPAKIAA